MSDGLILLDKIPDLDNEYEPASADLAFEYWSPTEEGEYKRLIFWEISEQTVPDFSDREKNTQLNCVIFIEPDGSGGYRTIANGSKRLVATLENCEIAQGTPLQITFQGNKPNRTNSNKSDRWSVVTLKKKSGKK